jgi:hypothetical protein
MELRLVRYTAEWEPAVLRFNGRLQHAGVAPFLLPSHCSPPGALHREHWLVADAEQEVRGGCLLQLQAAWVNGAVCQVANLQSPLSEGLADRRFAALSPWMLRELMRQHPLLYSVGMGGEQMPYPRLLKALRWHVQPVPFFFHVLGGRRVLKNLVPIRQHPRLGPFARVAAAVPLAADLGFTLLHGVSRRRGSRGSSGASSEWSTIRARYAFAIERTPAALDLLYPEGDSRFVRLQTAGARGVMAISQFNRHKYFGDLRVATLVEALGDPAGAAQLSGIAVRAARELRVDLLVTNQSDPQWGAALRACGWFEHTSNYLVALSPPLSAAIGQRPIYVTRGDGDGLVNL